MKKTLKTQVLDFIQSLNRPVTRGEIIRFYQEKIKNHKYNPTEDRGLLSFQLRECTGFIDTSSGPGDTDLRSHLTSKTNVIVYRAHFLVTF